MSQKQANPVSQAEINRNVNRWRREHRMEPIKPKPLNQISQVQFTHKADRHSRRAA